MSSGLSVNMKSTYSELSSMSGSINEEVVQRRLAQGRCAACGLQTHQLIRKSRGLKMNSRNTELKMTPLTNSNVLGGRCLLCYPIAENVDEALNANQQPRFAVKGQSTLFSPPSGESTCTKSSSHSEIPTHIPPTFHVQSDNDGIEVSIDNSDMFHQNPWTNASQSFQNLPNNLIKMESFEPASPFTTNNNLSVSPARTESTVSVSSNEDEKSSPKNATSQTKRRPVPILAKNPKHQSPLSPLDMKARGGSLSSNSNSGSRFSNSKSGSINSSQSPSFSQKSGYTAKQLINYWIPPTPSISPAKDRIQDEQSREAIEKALNTLRMPVQPEKLSEHVKTVGKLMKQHNSSARVLQAACMQLFTMVSDHANAKGKNTKFGKKDEDVMSPVHYAILQHKITPQVIATMATFPDIADMQVPALGVLYTLARHTKYQNAIRDAGGLETLACIHDLFSSKLVQDEDSLRQKFDPQHIEIQKMSCIAWANLVARNSVNQTLAAQLGAIKLIIRSIKNSGKGSLKFNPGICLFGGGALANMGARHSDNLDAIRTEGGLQLLEKTFKYFSELETPTDKTVPETKVSYKPLLQLLRAAVGNVERDAIQYFDKEQDKDDPYTKDTIERVVRLMKYHANGREVATEGCRLIWHMSASGNLDVAKSEQAFSIDDFLREAGAIEVLVHTLHVNISFAEVADVACGALWNLTSTNEANQERFREMDGIKTLASVLFCYRYPENQQVVKDNPQFMKDTATGDCQIEVASPADVVGNCMCTIANVVAKNKLNQTCMRAAGAIPLIIECMNNHFDMLDVQHFALGALANLSYNHVENSREIVDQGGIPTIMHVMEHYKNHAEIQASACGALSNICAAGRVGAREELYRVDSIKILREAATNFPNSCGKYVDEIVTVDPNYFH